jgi:hypothetical protein
VDAAAGFLAAGAPPEEEAAMDAELAVSGAADAGGRGAIAGAVDTPGVDRPPGPPPGTECPLTASRRDSAAGRAAAVADGPAAAAEPMRRGPQAGGEPAELRRQLARVGLRARFYFTKARQLEAALARQAATGARLRRANEALSARLAAALAGATPDAGPIAAPQLPAVAGPGAEASRVSAVVVIPAVQAGARSHSAAAASVTGRVVVIQAPEPASTTAGAPAVDGAEAAGPEPMPGPDEGLADVMQGPGHAATRGPRLSLDNATLTLNPGEDPLASQTSLEWVEGLMRAPSQGSQPELHLAALGAAAAAAAGRPAGTPSALAGALAGLARLPAGAAAAGHPAEVELPMAVLCASQDPAPGAPDPLLGGSQLDALAFDAAPVPAPVPGAGAAQAAAPEEQCAVGMEGLKDVRTGLGDGTLAVPPRADAPGTAGGRGSSVGGGPGPAVPALDPGGAGSGRGLLTGRAAAERAERRGSGSPRLLLVSRCAAQLALLRIRLHARPWRAPDPWTWLLCWFPRLKWQGVPSVLLGKCASCGPRAADHPPAAHVRERPWQGARQCMSTSEPGFRASSAAPARRPSRRSAVSNLSSCGRPMPALFDSAGAAPPLPACSAHACTPLRTGPHAQQGPSGALQGHHAWCDGCA